MTPRRSDPNRASFATPARGLIVPTAEGRRLSSLREIPTEKRRRAAITALCAKPESDKEDEAP